MRTMLTVQSLLPIVVLWVHNGQWEEVGRGRGVGRLGGFLGARFLPIPLISAPGS